MLPSPVRALPPPLPDHRPPPGQARGGRHGPASARTIAAAALLILRQPARRRERRRRPAGRTTPARRRAVTWTPPPIGGALRRAARADRHRPAGEFRPRTAPRCGASLADRSGASATQREHENCPVPTVLPALDTTLTPEQLHFASVHNGFADARYRPANGSGGAQGFPSPGPARCWSSRTGRTSSAPAPRPKATRARIADAAEHRSGGSRSSAASATWVVLSHHWTGEGSAGRRRCRCSRGAYELTVEFVQPAPDFVTRTIIRLAAHRRSGQVLRARHRRPAHRRSRISRLFLRSEGRDARHGHHGPAPARSSSWPISTSARCATSAGPISARSRRCCSPHRFGLSAPSAARTAAPSSATCWTTAGVRRAVVLPQRRRRSPRTRPISTSTSCRSLDDYLRPPAGRARRTRRRSGRGAVRLVGADLRLHLAARRRAKALRPARRGCCSPRPREKQPADPGSLLRHMGADLRHCAARCCATSRRQRRRSTRSTSADLEDDRWAVRAWHADRWLRRARSATSLPRTSPRPGPTCGPADDPGAACAGRDRDRQRQPVRVRAATAASRTAQPRRYEELRRLNDGLRERGRDALVAYLCALDRVALPGGRRSTPDGPATSATCCCSTSRPGCCERASRIEEAISAVQAFIRRARLGLEPAGPSRRVRPAVGPRFATFRVWQACKRREIYKENWIEWDELRAGSRDRGVPASLTRAAARDADVAVPGGVEWWPDERPPAHPALRRLLQRPRAVGSSQLLPPPREGLDLLGTPERGARPSWLAPVSPHPAGGSTGSNGPGDRALADAAVTAPAAAAEAVPFWMQAAIRLGTRFLRVAAAGSAGPRAGQRASRPHPHPTDRAATCCAECGCEHRRWSTSTTSGSTRLAASSPTRPRPAYRDADTDGRLPGRLLRPDAPRTRRLWQDPTQLPAAAGWHPGRWCGSPGAGCTTASSSSRGARTDAVAGHAGHGHRADFAGRTARLAYLPGDRRAVARQATTTPPRPASATTWPPTRRSSLPAGGRAAAAADPTSGRCPPIRTSCYLRPGRAGCSPARRSAPRARRRLRPAHPLPVRGRAQVVRAAPSIRCTSDYTWVAVSCRRTDPPPVAGRHAQPRASGTSLRGRSGRCVLPGHDTDITTAPTARDRSVLLHYLETLLQWGDALLPRTSPEAFAAGTRHLRHRRARSSAPRPRAVRREDAVRRRMTVGGLHRRLARAAQPAAARPVRAGRRPAGADPRLPRRHRLRPSGHGVTARTSGNRPRPGGGDGRGCDVEPTRCADGDGRGALPLQPLPLPVPGRRRPWSCAAQVARARRRAARRLREGRRRVPGRAAGRPRARAARPRSDVPARTSGATPTGRSRRSADQARPPRPTYLYYSTL